MVSKDRLSNQVRELARRHGFTRVGFASAESLPAERVAYFKRWLAEGLSADMDYLARHAELRWDPACLMEGARSVICLAVGYGPGDRSDTGLTARYSRGRDYHKVLKHRCFALMDDIRRIEPGFEGRAFVDSAPLMERSLAVQAGLGWIGKNGCLISPPLGSYVVLAEIVSNLPLPPGRPVEGSCGDCRLCQAACPTGAIVAPGQVDARLCLSYHTIENGRDVPEQFWPAFRDRLFGCDACQAACPHNQGLPAGDAELQGQSPSLAEVLAWSRSDWDTATRGKAWRRASWETWLRNAILAAGSSDDRSLVPAVRCAAAACADRFDRYARWTLDRLADAEVVDDDAAGG